MRYIIIGLGIYGTNLARDLAALGHEVIGADIKPGAVQAVKDYISATYIVDSTDPEALGALPLKGVDMVIVAIGENFGASVKTVALLKSMGIKHLYARATDELHHAILDCFELERILTPEQYAANHLSQEMLMGTSVNTLGITAEVFIAKFAAPELLWGNPYRSLKLADYGMTLIAATRGAATTSVLDIPGKETVTIDIADAQSTVAKGDILIVMTTRKGLVDLRRHTS